MLMPLSSGSGCMLHSNCQPKPTILQTCSLLLTFRCGLSDSFTQAEGIHSFLLSNRLIVQELLQTEQFTWYPSTHKLLPSQGNCQEYIGSRVLGMAWYLRHGSLVMLTLTCCCFYNHYSLSQNTFGELGE